MTQKPKIIIQASPDENGVRLRMDDDNHLEFWLEVFISKGELANMMKEIENVEPSAEVQL